MTTVEQSKLRIQKLVAEFSCLDHKPGTVPWDALQLDSWAATVASDGEKHAARFVLQVWSLYENWKVGQFNIVAAMEELDEKEWDVIVRWCQNPWRC